MSNDFTDQITCKCKSWCGHLLNSLLPAKFFSLIGRLSVVNNWSRVNLVLPSSASIFRQNSSTAFIIEHSGSECTVTLVVNLLVGLACENLALVLEPELTHRSFRVTVVPFDRNLLQFHFSLHLPFCELIRPSFARILPRFLRLLLLLFLFLCTSFRSCNLSWPQLNVQLRLFAFKSTALAIGT